MYLMSADVAHPMLEGTRVIVVAKANGSYRLFVQGTHKAKKLCNICVALFHNLARFGRLRIAKMTSVKTKISFLSFLEP